MNIHFLSLFNNKMACITEFFPREKQSQLFGCWWPGDAESQGITSHGIDRVVPEYSGFSNIRVDSGFVNFVCYVII